MNGERFCEYCGSSINNNARFCPSCGQPVRSVTPTGFVSAATPEIPPTQKMEEPVGYPPQNSYDAGSMFDIQPAQPPKKNSRNLLMIGGAVLVLIICMGVALIAIGSKIFSKDSGFALFTSPTPAFEVNTVTQYPTEIAPTEQGLTGRQELSQTGFFDDFSSTALKWPQLSDQDFACDYQNGGFFIEVKHPDYRQVIFSPVDALTHLEFTAEIFEGSKNGGFGVACFYQDIKNFYFIDFYNIPVTNHPALSIGRFEKGNWVNLKDAVETNTGQGPQRYAVDCTPGIVSVYVNSALVTEYEVTQPFPSKKMHLYVWTWENSDGGIKVIFDDVSGYMAMQ